jgi:hypothetical protein
MVFRFCSGPSSKGSILVGRELCRTVDMPEFWEKGSGELQSTRNVNVEYRKGLAGDDSWCLAHKDLYTEDRSLQMLCISNDSVSLFPIDPKWAVKPTHGIHSPYQLQGESPETFKAFVEARQSRTFKLPGLTVKLAGDSWCDLVHPSPDQKYAMLASCNADNWLERLITPKTWWGTDPGSKHSPAYIQCIDLVSGEEVIRIRYELTWLSGSETTDDSGWLDSRTLVSLNKHDRKVTICTLP